MKAKKYLLIEAENPFEDKIGSIYLDPRFDTQEKSKQVFPIVDVPDKFKKHFEKGDRAIIHFNIVSFQIRDGKKVPSHYNFVDDVYFVPENMWHGIVKKDGSFVMLDGWILIDPIKKPLEEVLDSGIILVKTDKMKIKHELMRGTIVKSCENSTAIADGEEVLLTNHSDYSVMIDGKEYWLVKDHQIVADIKFLETVGKYEDE